MLTQIEIDGFKTFKDFKVELAPFQVIVGPNGSGKSNLFDALQLLALLADTDVRSAFQNTRGGANELFTLQPDGKRVNTMRLAVEMLLDKNVRDNWGRQGEVKYRRLRYELEIKQNSRDSKHLYITHESLRPILSEEDTWSQRYELPFLYENVPQSIADAQAFIDTVHAFVHDGFGNEEGKFVEKEPVETDIIFLYSEEHGGNEAFPLNAEHSVLSSVGTISSLHAFAARQEMLSLKLLHPDPEELRQPSSVKAPSFLSENGSNLPTMLARMKDADEFALTDVSRDLANLVPNVTGVELKNDDVLNRYIVSVKYQDGRSFPSSVLSDGTLRLLALVALKNDPQFRGVLCFEEPENGIHPSYLKDIAHLLRSMVTDLSDPEQVDEPLRQVLVTTHSPTFISQPDAIDVVLFTHTVTRVEPQSTGIPPMRITQVVPVVTTNDLSSQIDFDTGKAAYTIDRVKELLINESLDDALELLDKSHTMLNERSQ
ncbi:MAG TPA: AAA family ATPase [Ktedonobacteraceae bacterium]|nr:AAA family ATPase [Ktedonobacteraceae bacterium]